MKTYAIIRAAFVTAAIGLGGQTIAVGGAVAGARPAALVTLSVDNIAAGDALAPAIRSKVRAAIPAATLPPELAAEISAMVSSVGGCTNTLIGESVVGATHCRQGGFNHDGDIAWTGAQPQWVDPALIPIGATIYGIGYPRATPGPQVFTLSNLGSRTITLELRPQMVLMAVGDGVPCTTGASGMVAWVTIDGEMLPVGPLSVYSIDPAITGLPQGQYVCGFALSANP